MGSLSFRRSLKLGPLRFQLNSKRVSASEHLGPLTLSSTGRNSLKLFRGLRYRFKR